MKTKYPIYIISKGRWDRRQTVKTLDLMNVEYKICVEPSEYGEYARFIHTDKIIKLPEDFSELNQGSIPVRNYVWDMSLKNGDKWHWILDDNLESVEYYNNNRKVKCYCPQPFLAIEDFVDRYQNISQAGMHYSNFCPSCDARPPISFNTRIYSCILIRNDTGYRWRGRYNEDTDLSLRMLKDGWSTVIFRVFTVGKRATLTQGGGNTDTIYDTGDDRLAFAESLAEQHPDVVNVTRRFNRWHHNVDYRRFSHNDPRRVDFSTIGTVNNYGMKEIETKEK
jgi:hypothetical protein